MAPAPADRASPASRRRRIRGPEMTRDDRSSLSKGRVEHYLLLTAGLVPLVVLLALLEPLEPEKSLVMSSETSGSSGILASETQSCVFTPGTIALPSILNRSPFDCDDSVTPAPGPVSMSAKHHAAATRAACTSTRNSGILPP
ncbi:hypothetical protein EYF80_026490 [Liparis tanakae]|uniref:Uncharacterized protein n=1 Tax=Liparis tanakae TaxID=230148 RepID=A0A4Z2HBP5_9TELE|nr:hypothetical protein EYF80_026490 [Liparis tanakae]